MNDLIVSFIRTYVPITVGTFISWLATKGLTLDAGTSAGLVAFLTGLIIAAYYGIVRIVERYFPAAGVLLGSAKKPEYVETK